MSQSDERGRPYGRDGATAGRRPHVSSHSQQPARWPDEAGNGYDQAHGDANGQPAYRPVSQPDQRYRQPAQPHEPAHDYRHDPYAANGYAQNGADGYSHAAPNHGSHGYDAGNNGWTAPAAPVVPAYHLPQQPLAQPVAPAAPTREPRIQQRAQPAPEAHGEDRSGLASLRRLANEHGRNGAEAAVPHRQAHAPNHDTGFSLRDRLERGQQHPHGHAPAPQQNGYGFGEGAHPAPQDPHGGYGVHDGAAPQTHVRYPQDDHDHGHGHVAPAMRPTYGFEEPGFNEPADAQRYDLGNYGRPAAGHQPGAEPVFGGEYGDRNGGYDQYGQPNGYAQQATDPYGQQAYPDWSTGRPEGQVRYGAQVPYADPASFNEPGYDTHHQGYPDAHGETGQALVYDQTQQVAVAEPRSKRGLMMAAAAACVVAIGGGVAFGYGYFGIGGSGVSGEPIKISASGKPVKEMPTDPGGKVFPNADKKFNTRLGGERVRVASANNAPVGTEIANGPRRVSTLTITPRAGIEPPEAAPVTASSQPLVVPGVSIDSVLGGRAAPPRQEQRPADDQDNQAPQPQQPRVVAAVPVPPRSPPPQTTASVPVRPAPPKAQPPQTAEPFAPTSKSGANGYVAWVASSQDKLRALAQFANMQQRYGDVMAGKQPDIQEANLGAKGRWYRLRIGPPASREAAGELCKQLVGKGIKSCFVRAY